jgi:hypothetical protein
MTERRIRRMREVVGAAGVDPFTTRIVRSPARRAGFGGPPEAAAAVVSRGPFVWREPGPVPYLAEAASPLAEG